MKKVILGMSGGVDSSTAAYLLKIKGYEVIGVTLNQHLEETSDEIEDAKKIAKRLNIKHIVVNIYKEFKEKIIDYFLEAYNSGITPSPCVICDELIKFKILFDIAEKYQANYVATGHYSCVEYSKKYQKFLLKVVHNIIKDQSYMLYRLESSKLKKLIFPLEGYSKAEIRKIAKENGIEVHDKKDSQGICFAKTGYREFLQKELGKNIKKGNFVDKEGKILGEHEGYQLYTLGQRRGLGINLSKPIFIIDIKVNTNEIVLGEYSDLLEDEIELLNYKFNIDISRILNKRVLARPRFSSHGFYGELYLKNEKLYFKYEEANTHNADGQHLVIFDEDYVLGGGIIMRRSI